MGKLPDNMQAYAEAYLAELELTRERSEKFKRDRMGYTLDDLKAYCDAKEKDPAAKWPKPKYIP